MTKSNCLGSVIILANEDDAARTIRPRLDAAGADLSRVHIVEGVARAGAEADLFQLDTDVKDLREKVRQIGDVKLIIIDPPAAYLGAKVDAYKESDVRRILAPLTTLAHDTGALVLLVVHLNKRTDGGAQQRFGGSTAWIAAPRVAFLVSEEESTKNRFMVPVKNNLGDDRNGFAYRIVEKLIDYGDPRIKSSHVEWLGSTTRSAHELLNPPRQKNGSVVDDAKAFLRTELSSGPVMVVDLEASAQAAGVSWASVKRARTKLPIMAAKEVAGWKWSLMAGGRNV